MERQTNLHTMYTILYYNKDIQAVWDDLSVQVLLIFHLQPAETHTWKFNVLVRTCCVEPPSLCRLLITASFPCLSLASSALLWQPKCWNKTFYHTYESRRADVLHPNLEIRGSWSPRGLCFMSRSIWKKDVRWRVKHGGRRLVCVGSFKVTLTGLKAAL